MDEPATAPSEAAIEAWIAKYGRIFTIFHAEVVYWYRQLSRREYRLLLGLDDELDRDEQLVETCLLWPAGWTMEAHLDELAGNVSALAHEILAASGCVDLKATSDGYRQTMTGDIEMQMEATIDHVFGGGANFRRYTDWSYDQLFDAYARAEWIAVNLLGKVVKDQRSSAPAKPRRRGLANEAPPSRSEADTVNAMSGIDTDSRPMAQRSMADIAKIQAITARKIAMRQIWEKTPSVPVLPNSS